MGREGGATQSSWQPEQPGLVKVSLPMAQLESCPCSWFKSWGSLPCPPQGCSRNAPCQPRGAVDAAARLFHGQWLRVEPRAAVALLCPTAETESRTQRQDEY
ncbi:uncharacterized protein ACIQIH_014803 isoform 1-T1 [Cyanocitta cristata]